MIDSKENDEALVRMRGMLEYIEQFIKLDENVARKLEQHRLPDGTHFVLHQHELYGLPGLHLDLFDDDGPIWMRMERLLRSRPPEPSQDIADWLTISNDPDRPCEIKDTFRLRVSAAEKSTLLQAGTIFEDEFEPSLKDEPSEDGTPGFFDIAMRLAKRPELRTAIDTYSTDLWAVWAETERPRRKSIAVYQRLFEITQLLTAGNLDQSELVLGIGLSKWRTSVSDIDLPILIRSVEIQILEDQKAEIVVRPRASASQIELRAFQPLAPAHYNMAEDSARRALKSIETSEPEGVSPFRSETFEPVLKLCSSQLDPEGRYLPEQVALEPATAVPAPQGETLCVSDRFVLFARRRTLNVVVADIERLKSKLSRSEGEEGPVIAGAARTLVLGPRGGLDSGFVPLGSIGALSTESVDAEPEVDHDHADLFFPKPFNDDQVAIVRRLEKSDGVVVQGPPGTGKTHTIANIISHMLATGKRILVISHGETALSVIREQLPDKLRDLAISVTTSDRDGERQIENAVSLMLQIVNDFAANHLAPRRRIAAIEESILKDRRSLTEIDHSIARIAEAHLSVVPGSTQTPFDVAKKLMSEREEHQWFPDRPIMTVEQSAMDTEIVEAGLAARRALKSDIKYINAVLPSVVSLPDIDTLDRWRADLLLSKQIEAAAAYANLTRRVVAKVAVSGAEAILDNIEKLLSLWSRILPAPWAEAIFGLETNADVQFASMRDQIDALSESLSRLGLRTQDFLTRSVSIPDKLPPNEELFSILGNLANGKNPFGLLSFKLKKHQDAIQKITINGSRPAGIEDWRHVSSFLALKADLDEFEGQWQSVCSALQIEAPVIVDTLPSVAAAGTMLHTALNLPKLLKSFQKNFVSLAEDDVGATGLFQSRDKLEGFAKALSSRLSQIRLAAVRQEVDEVKARIPADAVDINVHLRQVLESLGDSSVNSDLLYGSWEQQIASIGLVRNAQAHFEAVELAAREIINFGAPSLAEFVKSQPYIADGDPIRTSWKDAWNWWAHHHYLSSLGAHEELSKLHRMRTQVETRLRASFAELVRERAFYALAGAMSGPAMSALKAFADLVRRLGKGTGKKAAMHRRELRSVMQRCYDSVPCWIMPAWRVSEQLPSEFGSFDLVILDEASQSDAKELPALLRGKKVLIVGDDRQVSPTDAFIRQDDIERLQMNYLKEFPFPTHLLPGSSIYDLARVMFPNKFVMLKEHFRCVEPIIRFSMQFYSEPLIPLRIPNASERLDPPLIDIHVKDGQRHKTRKINEREAEVITDEIEQLVNNANLSHIDGLQKRARSIGVISLIGGEQARLIQQRVIERIGEPKFIEHRVICGDSAIMQGNERDVVFLSMVAGSEGRIGAQTAEQYRRRFNVALSRAKDRMVLVRSIDESRLNPIDLKAKVIRHFRDPMPAAVPSNSKLVELCQSSFEREIFQQLTRREYTVTPQVGSLGYSIDLVVEGANGSRLAIECDGDLYHGPDRWSADMRRQRILERVGWRFWRVFGSTYSLDPDGVLNDLIQTLDQLGIKSGVPKELAGRWTEHRTISATASELDFGVNDDDSIFGDAPSSDGSSLEAADLSIGDRIVLRFIDKSDSRPIFYVVTNAQSDAKAGLLNIGSPLAKQLAEVDVGDEFSFGAGDLEQRILFVAKQPALSTAMAAE
jgi:very-short-patch-repair endonuclease